MYGPAAAAAEKFIQAQRDSGLCLFEQYSDVATRFRNASAKLLKTTPENITIPVNTSEALSTIANGYPFSPGDEIISYVHEYPANHYPWRLQEKRGVKLKLLKSDNLSGKIPEGYAGVWNFSELESLVTTKTKIIALSHVQFTSAYAADLEKLGKFCKDKKIDLVIDAAQSLGSLPVYPEEFGISAVAASGWKWLLGPIGTGVFYTSAEFRDKIEITMTGSDHMEQQTEYLNHTWQPYTDGRKFNYSTLPYSCVEALSTVIEEVFNHYGIEAINKEILRLQELGLSLLDRDKFEPVLHDGVNRAGFISLIPRKMQATEIQAKLIEKGVIISAREKYLRFAPHFCNTDEEIEKGINILNTV